MRLDASSPLYAFAERMHRGHCWVKTPQGPRRLSDPLDTLKLAAHLAGVKAYGLCPIAPGTAACRVACLDFDNHRDETTWEALLDTAHSVAFVLEQEGYFPHLFRSSGGRGVHLYITWAQPQDAYSVRVMLKNVLASLELKNGTDGVAKGQVEIFPKQDHVPSDGFGSMFILPWWGQSTPLTSFDGWHDSPPVPVEIKPPRPEPVVSACPEVAQLRSALAAIPNDTQPLDFEDWRNVLFALHYATQGSEVGHALAHEFSARSPKYDADFLDNRVWPYIGVNSSAPITERTLFAMARHFGWVDPALLDGFEVLPDEVVNRLRFQFVQAAQFSAGKPPGWIIRNVLPRGELIVLYGESGAGKSFLAIDLIGAIARGVDWRGHRTTQGLRCGYIAAEGAAEFRMRLVAYARHHEIELSQLPLAVMDGAPNFTEKADITDLIKSIRSYGPLDIIVVDTLAQVIPGANENSGEDMGRVIAHCKALHRATGATILLVHHSGKDASKGARGWSGLKGALNAELEITKDAMARVVTITKMKDGRGEGEKYGFRLAEIPLGVDEYGDEYGSCVVEPMDFSAHATGQAKPKGRQETIVHGITVDLLQEVGAATVDSVLSEYENRIPCDPQAVKDSRRRTAMQALQSLITKEILVVKGLQITLPSDDDADLSST